MVISYTVYYTTIPVYSILHNALLNQTSHFSLQSFMYSHCKCLIWPNCTILQIFNTSLAEPVPEGYENISDIVPPYNAFSAKGQPEVNIRQTTYMKVYSISHHRVTDNLLLFLQGELVYVNYGHTEDFFQLEKEMGINVTGKIVIVRYGKIFRGNKVRNWTFKAHQCEVISSSMFTVSPTGEKCHASWCQGDHHVF